jgi:hypothetical protein
MKKLLMLTGALCLALAAGSAHAGLPIVIYSDDFEDGDASDWTLEVLMPNGGGGINQPGINGAYDLLVWASPPDPAAIAIMVSPVINVTPSQMIEIDALIHVKNDACGFEWGFIGVRNAGVDDLFGLTFEGGQHHNADTWWVTPCDIGVLQSPVFHATGNTIQVIVGVYRVCGWGQTVEVDFDDIVVSTIPEPGTMMLLGSGLVGLVAFVRRKFLA